MDEREAGPTSTRPPYPITHQGNVAKMIGVALFVAAVGVGLLAMLMSGSIRRVPGDEAATWALVAVASVFIGVAAFVVDSTCRRVVIDERGIVECRLFRTKRTDWSALRTLELAATSDKKARNAHIGHAVGGVVGGLLAGAMTTTDSADPFENAESRPRFSPSATLRDSRGRRLARLGPQVPWEFYDDLRAEAEARGIDIRRVVR